MSKIQIIITNYFNYNCSIWIYRTNGPIKRRLKYGYLYVDTKEDKVNWKYTPNNDWLNLLLVTQRMQKLSVLIFNNKKNVVYMYICICLEDICIYSIFQTDIRIFKQKLSYLYELLTWTIHKGAGICWQV